LRIISTPQAKNHNVESTNACDTEERWFVRLPCVRGSRFLNDTHTPLFPPMSVPFDVDEFARPRLFSTRDQIIATSRHRARPNIQTFGTLLIAFRCHGEERGSYFDTKLPGKSSQGHNFPEVLSEEEKNAVLEYLKAL